MDCEQETKLWLYMGLLHRPMCRMIITVEFTPMDGNIMDYIMKIKLGVGVMSYQFDGVLC